MAPYSWLFSVWHNWAVFQKGRFRKWGMLTEWTCREQVPLFQLVTFCLYGASGSLVFPSTSIQLWSCIHFQAYIVFSLALGLMCYSPDTGQRSMRVYEWESLSKHYVVLVTRAKWVRKSGLGWRIKASLFYAYMNLYLKDGARAS